MDGMADARLNIIEKYRSMMAEPKQRVAFSSVIAAVILVLIKLYVGIITNSLGILSEALHSGLDLLAAAITWAAVYSANKPPDSEHQFGHGKFENFSALIETILLLITCIWIIWEAFDRIFYGSTHADANLLGFGVMAFSIVLNYSRARALKSAAKKYNSQALEADALHFESDIWGSIVVIIGLGFVYIGIPLGDPISALCVAVIIIYASIELGKRTVDVLMDRAPAGKSEEIKNRIEKIEGVVCERVRVRCAGAHTFVDVNILLDRQMPFELSHDFANKVEKAVKEIVKNADVMVHVNPEAKPYEDIGSKLTLLGLKMKGIKGVHNVQVHKVNGKVSIDAHLEISGDKTIKDAHELANDFETKAKKELDIDEITTHIESHSCTEIVTEDATKDNMHIVEKVKEIVNGHAKVFNCHGVIVRKEGEKISLVLHCNTSHDKTIAEAHELSTELEKMIRDEIKELDHITIHIEPSKQTENI